MKEGEAPKKNTQDSPSEMEFLDLYCLRNTDET